jgi:hypothetical protein
MIQGEIMKNFLAALVLALAITTSQAVAAGSAARDYSHVTSHQAAEAMVSKGELAAILLFPAEFGGEDVPENKVYVPPGIPELKEQNTETLIRFFKEGLIDNLTVTPEYRDDSLVPTRIVIKATHSTKKSGTFEPTIEIW